MITEGFGTFDAVRGLTENMKLPYSLHALRLVYRNFLTLDHRLVIIPIVLIIFPHPIQWLRLVHIVPGMVLAMTNGVAISLLLGSICAPFRDVAPIIASIVQVVFFVTPNQSGRPARWAPNQWWAVLNPLYTVIDVMRSARCLGCRQRKITGQS